MSVCMGIYGVYKCHGCMETYWWGITQRLPLNELDQITSDFDTYCALLWCAQTKYPKKASEVS